jgi:hypothetical protein
MMLAPSMEKEITRAIGQTRQTGKSNRREQPTRNLQLLNLGDFFTK